MRPWRSAVIVYTLSCISTYCVAGICHRATSAGDCVSPPFLCASQFKSSTSLHSWQQTPLLRCNVSGAARNCRNGLFGAPISFEIIFTYFPCSRKCATLRCLCSTSPSLQSQPRRSVPAIVWLVVRISRRPLAGGDNCCPFNNAEGLAPIRLSVWRTRKTPYASRARAAEEVTRRDPLLTCYRRKCKRRTCAVAQRVHPPRRVQRVPRFTWGHPATADSPAPASGTRVP